MAKRRNPSAMCHLPCQSSSVRRLQNAQANSSNGTSSAISHPSARRFPRMNSDGSQYPSRDFPKHVPAGDVVLRREWPQDRQASRNTRILPEQVEHGMRSERGRERERKRQRVGHAPAQDDPRRESDHRDGGNAVRLGAVQSGDDIEVREHGQHRGRHQYRLRQSWPTSGGIGEERGCNARDGMSGRGRHSSPYSSTETMEETATRGKCPKRGESACLRK